MTNMPLRPATTDPSAPATAPPAGAASRKAAPGGPRPSEGAVGPEGAARFDGEVASGGPALPEGVALSEGAARSSGGAASGGAALPEGAALFEGAALSEGAAVTGGRLPSGEATPSGGTVLSGGGARETVLAGGTSWRSRWPWMVAGALAVVAVGSGAYAVSGAGGTVADGAGRPSAAVSGAAGDGVAGNRAGGAVVRSGEQVAVLNRTGADGAFIVTVTGVRCGVESVGPAELLQRAAGRFCLVSVDVENAGREDRLLEGGAQRAVDDHGRAYAVDDRAAAFLNGQAPTLLDEVAAGATVRGVLPFDVPAGTRLAALMAHESAGSRGARIALT